MLYVFLIGLVAPRSAAGAAFSPGEVLISTFADTGPDTHLARVVVHRADGGFQRVLTSTTSNSYRDLFVRDGVLIVATGTGIQRIDASGAALTPFSGTRFLTYLSPARDGGLVATNNLGGLYALGPDGNARAFRNGGVLNDPAASGIDLSPDQCTAFFITGQRLGSWNSCAGGAPSPLGPLRPGPTGQAIRLLPDGGFLAAYRTDISRVDAAGNELRTYRIPGSSLALDIDGTSFWTSVGPTLVKADIESGAILVLVNTPYNIFYISVVGEPRAALTATSSIPALSVYHLILLSLVLAFAALLRLK